jgi:hypothetical protein
MLKELAVEIRGIAPLLMHNGQTANPLNQYAKAMKEISSKRKKTDADHESLANIEWEASLYFDPESGPYIPAENIEAAIAESAGRKRTDMQAGLLCEGVAFKFDGPTELEALRADRRHWDQRPAVIQRSRIIRTRAKFPRWGAVLTLRYDDELLNERDVTAALELAGRRGICDHTPKFGRFEIVKK